MNEIKEAKCCGNCKFFLEVAEYCDVHKIGYKNGYDLDHSYICDSHEHRENHDEDVIFNSEWENDV